MNEPDPTGVPATAAPDPTAVDAAPATTVPAPDAAAAATTVPAPDAAAAAEAAWYGVAKPAPAAPVEADPVRAQNRLALIGTAVLVVALAFGLGFATGRVTAPGGGTGGTGSVLVPGVTSAPAASTGPSGTAPSPVASSGVAPTPPASAGAGLPSEGNRLGSADAKVVIDYWADFQCPFCAKLAREFIPQLSPLIEDGTVALVHRDFAFIGPESIDAAVAVRCAAREGRYWAMHDAVYAAQNGENKGAFARPKLVQIGTSVGLDGTKLEACLDERSVLVDVLDDTSAGMRLGIESTPTVIVNGNRFTGVPDLAKLKTAIDAAVAGASPAPQPSTAPSTNPWSAITADGRVAGDAGAPVTVDLWMDYQATDSAALSANVDPGLRTRIADGKVRAVLHDLALLGDESVTAATAVRCTAAQDGPTWFMHDILASAARGKDAGIFTPENLLRVVAQLGMDVRAFDACLSDPATVQAVKDETAEGQAAGLTAAPVIIVSSGGTETARFSGPPDAAKVLAAIDAAK